MKVVLPDEMQALERRFMDASGVTSEILMDRAADALLEEAAHLCGREIWPPRGNDELRPGLPRFVGIKAVICCGPGANGGDGWAVGHKLCDGGATVTIITVGLPRTGTAAYANYEKCRRCLVDMRIIDLKDAGLDDCEDGNIIGDYIVGKCGEAQLRAQLCVDAMFGTGLNRPLGGVWLGLSRMMARIAEFCGGRVLAVDIPSGLNGTTGENGGACPADSTVTFQFIKRGQLFRDGQDMCGRLLCRDIGIPPEYAPDGAPEYLAAQDAVFPRRKHDSYKGTYGHLLLIAGSERYAGAGLLCARAASRSGAGLITAACVRGLRQMLQLSVPVAMALEVEESGTFSQSCVEKVRAALKGKSALAAGPGICRNASPELIRLVLESGIPAVLDADALNIISDNPELATLLGERHVITPHPGEMARLAGHACSADPLEDARAFAAAHGCTVLLKGGVTCVAGAEGSYIMAPGTPGMACGGSGDVLTGIIAALLAQGYSPERAACLGALMHGRAGTLAAEKLGEIAMNASDIIDYLGAAFSEATAKRYSIGK